MIFFITFLTSFLLYSQIICSVTHFTVCRSMILLFNFSNSSKLYVLLNSYFGAIPYTAHGAQIPPPLFFFFFFKFYIAYHCFHVIVIAYHFAFMCDMCLPFSSFQKPKHNLCKIYNFF